MAGIAARVSRTICASSPTGWPPATPSSSARSSMRARATIAGRQQRRRHAGSSACLRCTSGAGHGAPGAERACTSERFMSDPDAARSLDAVATPPSPAAVIVTGVIGSDTHIVGNRILSMALESAGYKVIALGALTPATDFIKAAIETDADAILVSSLYGQGELDCRGFRDLCVEGGLADILLYLGGNLVVGKQSWP